MQQSLYDKIDKSRLPQHVAIIMDGNGRWAKERGKDRLYGHLNGVESVRSVTEGAAEMGIKYLTLYAFSTENWDRPKEEVAGLMSLLVETIHNEVPTLNKNQVRLLFIGDLSMLAPNVLDKMNEALASTSRNTGLTLVLALSYSSHWEITHAMQQIAQEVAEGKLQPDAITDEIIHGYLCTADIPDPELMVRTGGEHRISNFLLYQLAYAELYFTNEKWPDYRKEDLANAVIDYQSRQRRFGKTSEQIENGL